MSRVSISDAVGQVAGIMLGAAVALYLGFVVVAESLLALFT